MIVTLSTGQEVHVSDHYGRKAMRAFNVALAVRVGDMDLPMENFNLAVEAAMPLMIEKIKSGEVETAFSQEWLDGLSVADFNAVAEAVMAVRKASEKGKKK